MPEKGIIGEDYFEEVLHRQALMPYADKSIVIVHALAPAKKTHLAVAMLEHRIRRGNTKIRTILLLTMRPEDTRILFQLYYEILGGMVNTDETRMMKTREELMAYLSPRIQTT